MGFSTFALSDLIFDSKKVKGEQGVGNANVVYPDASIDAGIQWVTADSKAGKKPAPQPSSRTRRASHRSRFSALPPRACEPTR